MTPVAILLRDQILKSGPVSFRSFMDAALYHPEYGYYRRGRDPFGRDGDYFTAEQVQPVFGTLIAARVRQLFEELRRPPQFTVVELGAGRGEMAPAFSEYRYFPVDVNRNEWPAAFTGVVFCNEFFDALPVDAAVFRDGTFRQLLVTWRGNRFAWEEGPALEGDEAEYARRHFGAVEEGSWVEINLDALRWLQQAASRLEHGYVFTIDYGYTLRELSRFRQGTLMGYRRHQATEDVLAEPGEQDITAHVNFDALRENGARCGLETVRFETLARTLAAAGEQDGFNAALAANGEAEALRLRLQLKTLLFDIGERFRTLIQRKV